VQLLDYEFTLAGPIEGERGEDRLVLTYTAYERFANPHGLPLNAYGQGPFVRLRVPPLPRAPGVYAVARGMEVLYIGRARDSLFSRWGRGGYSVIDPRNCYRGGQSTNCHINNLIGIELVAGRELQLYTHAVADPSSVESRLIRSIRPPWNIQGG
jgi:hypothetical protein